MFNHFKCCKLLKKFKIKTENKGTDFVVTLSGTKEDVAKLEKKHDAMKVLMDDCCDEEGKCC